MDIAEIQTLLEKYKNGQTSLHEVIEELKILPYEDIGFAKIDHHRMLRQGFPEVIFCQGKTVEQVVSITQRLLKHNSNMLGSRATEEMYEAVHKIAPDAVYQKDSRLILIERNKLPKDEERFILVVTAGTSDIPVAEEAALTADIMGNKVERLYDVGVAGIHRLLSKVDLLQKANVIIVAAGMEGALASVVGGLVDKPVIAVPTSVGYGASFGGLAALFGMLNSCSAGIAVLNIDNGFGAGRLANIINHMR